MKYSLTNAELAEAIVVASKMLHSTGTSFSDYKRWFDHLSDLLEVQKERAKISYSAEPEAAPPEMVAVGNLIPVERDILKDMLVLLREIREQADGAKIVRPTLYMESINGLYADVLKLFSPEAP